MSVFIDGKIRFSIALRDFTKSIRLTTANGSVNKSVATSGASFDIDLNTGVLGLASALNFTVDNISSSTTFTKVVLQGQPITVGGTEITPQYIEIPLDNPVTFTVDGIFTLNSISVDYN